MDLILEMLFGSHLYGTDTPSSDKDFKGIYIPSKRELLLGKASPTISFSRTKGHAERNTADDVDREFFSLARYLELLTQGQTVALDMLFGAEYEDTNRPGDMIVQTIYANRDRLLTKNVAAFMGYAKQQAAKYGIKGSRMDALKQVKRELECFDPRTTLGDNSEQLEALAANSRQLVSLENTPLIDKVLCKDPSGIFVAPHLQVNGRKIPYYAKVRYALEIVNKMYDEYGKRAQKAHLAGGVDWKALSHAVRVNSEALELLTIGVITFPRPDRKLLIEIKTGQLPYEQVAELIEQGLANVVEASAKSPLREKPDLEWVDDFVYEIYRDFAKGE
jgi:hypothetical protein